VNIFIKKITRCISTFYIKQGDHGGLEKLENLRGVVTLLK